MKTKQLILNCLLIAISHAFLFAGVSVPSSCASGTESTQASPLFFAQKKLGYGKATDFLRINRGNPLARAVLKKDSEKCGKTAELILAPEGEALNIRPAFGKLEIKPGAIVYVLDDGNTCAIANMHDDGRNQVLFKYGAQQLEIAPGGILLLESGRSKSMMRELDSVGLRQMRRMNLTKENLLLEGEFSIASVLSHSATLSSLRNSNSSKDRKIVNTIMKTAAAYSLVTASHGPYSACHAEL